MQRLNIDDLCSEDDGPSSFYLFVSPLKPWVAWIGMLIVISTYGAREWFANSYKDNADALERVETVLESERQFKVVSARLDQIAAHWQNAAEPTGKQAENLAPSHDVAEARAWWFQVSHFGASHSEWYEKYDQLLYEPTKVAGAMPSNAEWQDALASCGSAMYDNSWHEGYLHLEQKLEGYYPLVGSFTDAEVAEMGELKKALDTNVSHVDEVCSAALSIPSEVNDLIGKQRERYELWNKVTTILYAVGWSLTVLGRFLGVADVPLVD